MLDKAILVHGVIGYKFCWLVPFEDHNQGTPAGHVSNGTTIRDHWEDMNQLRHQLGRNQSGIYNSMIEEVILIGDNTILLDYKQQPMGSLHAMDSRSWT